jgi:PPM family protein phosphatase
MQYSPKLDIVALTHIGLVRKVNEDAIAVDKSLNLVVLADGMGGYNAGEIASLMATQTILKSFQEGNFLSQPADIAIAKMQLNNAAQSANLAIYYHAQSSPELDGMGTTLVAGWFIGKTLIVGHIGDSRAYRLRKNALQRLTDDHSPLQEMISLGMITEQQAKLMPIKNIISKALGTHHEADIEMNLHDVLLDDVYLFCSDGLHDLVEDVDIHLTLSELNGNLASAAENLITLANNAGGKDNIAIILVRIVAMH